jgi:ribonuclease HII
VAVAVARRRAPAPGRRLLAHDCRLGSALVGGADEAGRGALAGPLVAAAVLLEPAALDAATRRSLRSLDDSKRCTHAVRERLLPCVLAAARRVTVVVRGVADVDAGGVHRANLGALAAALDGLDAPAEASLLVDGFRLPALRRPHRAIVDGDATSAAIAAASIVAKVVRDRLMVAAAPSHPAYGFERHVGYATPEHVAALRRHGPCALHRRSFAPCAQLALAF